MGDGTWFKIGLSNHGGTVDWIVKMLDHWSLVDAYLRVVTTSSRRCRYRQCPYIVMEFGLVFLQLKNKISILVRFW